MNQENKLLFIKTSGEYVDDIVSTLNNDNFTTTLIANTEGLLEFGNAILMVGVEVDRCDELLELLQQKFKGTRDGKSRDYNINIYVLGPK